MPTAYPTHTVLYTIARGNIGAGDEKTHKISGSFGKVATFTVEPDEDEPGALLNPDGTVEEVEVSRVRHRIDRKTGKRQILITVRNSGDVECSYVLHAAFVERAPKRILWTKTLWVTDFDEGSNNSVTAQLNGEDVVAEIALTTAWGVGDTHASSAFITQVVTEDGVEEFPKQDHESQTLVTLISRKKVKSVTFKVRGFHAKTAARAIIYSQK
jgi:hypothetical protein